MKALIRGLYRLFHQWFVVPWILPFFFSKKRIADARLKSLREEGVESPKQRNRRIWFHAASVGELESLWTVIEGWAADEENEWILTVFSESATQSLERLRDESGRLKGTLVYSGFSPWEGYWDEAFELLQPDCFVTAKYEAWPELWVAAAQRGVPLYIVGAVFRSSLTWSKRLAPWMGSIPQLRLLTTLAKDQATLESQFVDAKVVPVGDPRWDRVWQRAQNGHLRAQTLVEELERENLPRPWGVFGSIWESDLAFWGRDRLGALPGTLWIVPHRVEEEFVASMEQGFLDQGFRVYRTSLQAWSGSGDRSLVLVDEMGFLSELYGRADWAYVGGGFGDGVHSTIEPGIHGIPILCGPKKSEKFPEIEVLRASDQLTVVSVSTELDLWLNQVMEKWSTGSLSRASVDAHCGATKRVLSVLESELMIS